MVSGAGKIRGILIAVTLAVAASVTGLMNQASATATAQSSASQFVADMGAGWNLGNQLEANSNGYPSETAWGEPTVTQALIDKVKAAGFETIRIPVSYLKDIGPGPDYTIDPSWLNRVKQVVDYAYGRGMHVVINMHGDGYTSVTGSWLICDSSSQATIKDKYQKVWQQIATKFQNYDQHLIMESMNEEFTGVYGNPTQPCYSNINAYNQIFVDTVRRAGGNNSSRWLLVPGWNTNIDYTAGSYGFALPTDQYRSSSIPVDEQRIMVSVHYYDPWDFTGTESGSITQWGPAATNPSKTSTWGQADYLDSQLKKMHDTFVTKGYPVVVGEYGAIDKSSFDSSNNRYRADYAHTLTATAAKYGEATVYWDNGVNGQYGFGLFNRSSYAVTQQGIVDAIMSGVGGNTTGGTTGGSAGGTTTGGTTTGGTTTGGTGSSGCTATWHTDNSWPGGFTATITVTAGSTAINGWTVAWTWPSGVQETSGWNAAFTQSGSAVNAKNLSYNGTLAPAGSTSFGLQGTADGTVSAPTPVCTAS